jgi:diketogulonate reductase-like aldo/keto reductase
MSTAPLPPILYGTAWKKEHTAELVSLALRLGFRGVDTACQPKHYDEAGVGAGIAVCLAEGLARADLYLQTKFTALAGQDPERLPYDPRAPLETQVRQSFDTSLRNLQTTYLDCLVLHSPLGELKQTLTAWRAMEELASSGAVRQLGISNCYSLAYLKELQRAAGVKPAVVQNRFYADTGYDREIRAFCSENEIVYQSFWTLTANPHLLKSEPVRALAAKHERSPVQVLFRYLTQERVVPLTGTTREAHMREDLAIFEFELAADERAAITELLRGR